jgi:isopentenyl-diphosphate delta-isomerase
MKPEESVILVDENDNEIGKEEKIIAHRQALLHRAISVFIVNSNGEWLLQQRALDKYHSKGLWTNTCCSHPYPGETCMAAANRRLMEEMGLTATLKEIFHFTYKESLENDLTEYEVDHVFIGVTDEKPSINSSEVLNWKYIDYQTMAKDIKQNPENYTVWFMKIYNKVNEFLTEQQ